MRVSIDLLRPSMEELSHLEYFFKSSSSLVRHDLIIHSVKYPAIVTYSKAETVALLKKLKEDDWEENKKKPQLV